MFFSNICSTYQLSSFGLVMSTQQQCSTIRLRPLILSSHKGSGGAVIVICIDIFVVIFWLQLNPNTHQAEQCNFAYLLRHVITRVPVLTLPLVTEERPEKTESQSADTYCIPGSDNVFLLLRPLHHTVYCQDPAFISGTKTNKKDLVTPVKTYSYQEGTENCEQLTFSAGNKTRF